MMYDIRTSLAGGREQQDAPVNIHLQRKVLEGCNELVQVSEVLNIGDSICVQP